MARNKKFRIHVRCWQRMHDCVKEKIRADCDREGKTVVLVDYKDLDGKLKQTLGV